MLAHRAVRRLALIAIIVPTISRADSTTPSCVGHTACQLGDDWAFAARLPTFVVELGPMTRRIV